MGWVRGQTGEQKRKEKQRKDLPGLGSGGIRAGRPWLGCGTRCLHGRCITGWERDPLGDRRLPTADIPGRGSRVGAAQGLPAAKKEGKGGKGGRRGRPQGIPGLSATLTSLPGRHPKVGWRGVGRVQQQQPRGRTH